VPRQSEAGVDGGSVEFEAVAEAVQVGQIGRAGCCDPLGELQMIAGGRLEQFGEVAWVQIF
jgi:hypothetical protein